MLRLLTRILNVLVVLLLLRVVLRGIAAWIRGSRRGSRAPAAPAGPVRDAGQLVRDRVCNTFLPRDQAVHALVDGRQEHFCSTACRDRALAEALKAS